MLDFSQILLSNRTLCAPPDRSLTVTTRSYLAVLMVLPILLVSLGTILVPGAQGVFEWLLPLVTLILGYYFSSTRQT
jgi:hypothetical protein